MNDKNRPAENTPKAEPAKKKVRAWPFIAAAVIIIAAVVIAVLCTGGEEPDAAVQEAIDAGNVINIGGVDCVALDNAVSVYGYSGEGGEVAIPNMVGQLSVTAIEAGAFKDCKSVTAVLISSAVTSIGKNAFSGCSGLTDVYFFGTQAQWDAIALASGNDPLLKANLQLVSDEG